MIVPGGLDLVRMPVLDRQRPLRRRVPVMQVHVEGRRQTEPARRQPRRQQGGTREAMDQGAFHGGHYQDLPASCQGGGRRTDDREIDEQPVTSPALSGAHALLGQHDDDRHQDAGAQGAQAVPAVLLLRLRQQVRGAHVDQRARGQREQAAEQRLVDAR
jgi:hypothetical protein